MSSTPTTAGIPEAPARDVTPELERRLGRLRFWNIGVGLVLAVEAVAIALLTNGFTLPVTSTYMSGPPGTPAELTTLFDVPLGWGVFAFVAISALALFTIASPGVFELVQAQPAAGPQLRALDRVLLQLQPHDRAHQP